MWFKFPSGTTEISVERQNFIVEATDSEGNGYFRAPNHFASTILSLKGFAPAEQPEGGPKDLDPNDVLRNGAISDLGKQVVALTQELSDAKSGLISLNAELRATQTERDQNKLLAEKYRLELEDLKNDIEEGEKTTLTSPGPVLTPTKK